MILGRNTLCLILLLGPYINYAQKSIFERDTVEFAMIVTDIDKNINPQNKPGCHKLYNDQESWRKKSYILSCDTIKKMFLSYRKNDVNYCYERMDYDIIEHTGYRLHRPFREIKTMSEDILIGNYAPFKSYIKDGFVYYKFLKDNRDDYEYYYSEAKNGATQIQASLKKKDLKIKGSLPFFIHSFLTQQQDSGGIIYQKDTLLKYTEKIIDCYVFRATASMFHSRNEYTFVVEKKSLLPVITTHTEYLRKYDYDIRQDYFVPIMSSIVFPIFKD